MQRIDPNSPAYRGLTKAEIRGLKYFTDEEKNDLSLALFGEPLVPRPAPEPTWQEHRSQRWKALIEGEAIAREPYPWNGHKLIERLERLEELGYEPMLRLSRAKRTRNVSGFADWVLRLYIADRDPTALQQGLDGERAVVDHQAVLRQAKLEVPRWEYRGWKLVHDGIRGQFDGGFEISTLQISGESLLGVPDLVFRERETNRIAIVELKVSRANLPSDGWPNLRAQLWAYSKIDRWSSAPEIILAGEVWVQTTATECIRRATYRWLKGDTTLDNECSALFRKYGGASLNSSSRKE